MKNNDTAKIHRRSDTTMEIRLPKRCKKKDEITSKTLKFLLKFKKFTFWAMLALGLSLVVTTIIGGLFFNVESPVIACWFVVALVLVFAVLSMIALVTFIVWYWKALATPAILLASILCVMGASWLFIAPDFTPFMNIFDLLSPIFGLLG